nr:copia protein [Tanacetum cinerariifolium]
TQTYVLFSVLYDGSTNPKNNNKDALADGKEHDDDIQKSVSPDIHSSSCGDQTREQGDKTENKDKGKSHVVTITGFRDFNEEFAECINNSSNEVNAVDDVGVEADINNMESIISFKMQKVWILVDLPYGKRAIGTKWVYRNKKNERCIVIKNKARLVAQGHTQEEVIDYEEVFALVARIKAIRLFLAYASFMRFPMYQMDVKSAFLYGTIEEEVYVCQPPGFEDPKYPDKVYKVVKALYGLHQAPRAWYETLATYLLENGFQRGTIDQTLFIKKQQKNILLVQIYVDDIIFVKRIFRYLKGKPCLGFLYPKDSPFDLVAYSDSDYAVVATSTIGAEYVAAASGYAQKSDAAEGFEQIIDFLSGSYIHYALTVNPHIYISKKIVISEDVIREILQLDDAEGVVCFPNEEIFAGLAQMGYEKPSTKLTFYKDFFSSQCKFLIHTLLQSLSAKRTSWNEFSTAMDFAVICLSQEEGIAEEQVQADGAGAVAAAVQETVVEDVATQAIPSTRTPLILPSPPSHIPSSPPQQPHRTPQAPPQSAKVPPHLLQQVLDTCSTLTCRVETLKIDNTARKLEIIKLKARVKRLGRANTVKTSKFRRLKKVGTSQRIKSSDDMEDVFNQGRMIDNLDKDEGIELVADQIKDADIPKTEGRHAAEQAEKQAEIYNLDLDHPLKVLSMQEDDLEVQEVVKVVNTAKLITDVFTAASQVSAASATISAAKPKESSSKTPTETPGLKDKGKGILIESPKPMKKNDQIELDAEYARKLHEEINKDDVEINKDIDWDAAINHVQQRSMGNQYIKRYHRMKKKPQTESESRKNMIAYLKNTDGFKMDFFREVEDLKKQLEIVNDEDDDVFTESTPLERKLLELMLSKRSKKNTKCVNAADEELTAAKHRIDSAYKTRVRQKREGLKSNGLDELCRQVQTALGTTIFRNVWLKDMVTIRGINACCKMGGLHDRSEKVKQEWEVIKTHDKWRHPILRKLKAFMQGIEFYMLKEYLTNSWLQMEHGHMHLGKDTVELWSIKPSVESWKEYGLFDFFKV